jgi:crotonobetainyl-CoA:carnitine CoA-transferase CaiB-like acyl-CoA transferase
VAAIFADPHAAARGMLAEVEQPGAPEPVVIAGTPIKLDGSPGGVRRRAPLLGEHSREILAEAGFAPDEVDGLVECGAVRDGE